MALLDRLKEGFEYIQNGETSSESLTEEYVQSCFEKIIEAPKRGQRNGTAQAIYAAFRGRVSSCIRAEELRAHFAHSQNRKKATATAVTRINKILTQEGLDLGIESCHYERQIRYRLIRPSQR